MSLETAAINLLWEIFTHIMSSWTVH